MERNIEFKKVSSEFWSNLPNNIKRINENPLLFIPADKTSNLYKLSKDIYNKLLIDNITKSYIKTNTAAINTINKEAICIVERLHLDDRVEQFNQRESFVTLKDHKENFQNNPKCRLLNHAKSEIGIISKHYIEKINSNIRKATNMNQWQNTQAVITWFKSIGNKRSSSFIKFDIVDFTKSINYAKSITIIEERSHNDCLRCLQITFIWQNQCLG